MNYGVKKAIAGTRRGFRKGRSSTMQGFDDAYSAKIRDMYEGAPAPVQAAGNSFLGGHPSLRKGQPLPSDDGTVPEGMAAAAIEYGLPAINAVPKYALPAAGVALAGKGIMDLATGNAFGGAADQPEPQQLRM